MDPRTQPPVDAVPLAANRAGGLALTERRSAEALPAARTSQPRNNENTREK